MINIQNVKVLGHQDFRDASTIIINKEGVITLVSESWSYMAQLPIATAFELVKEREDDGLGLGYGDAFGTGYGYGYGDRYGQSTQYGSGHGAGTQNGPI